MAINYPHPFRKLTEISAAYLVLKAALLLMTYESDGTSAATMILLQGIIEMCHWFSIGTLEELTKLLWLAVAKNFHWL